MRDISQVILLVSYIGELSLDPNDRDLSSQLMYHLCVVDRLLDMNMTQNIKPVISTRAHE